jgi:hypothetical protein
MVTLPVREGFSVSVSVIVCLPLQGKRVEVT